MDVENLAKELILKNMTPEQQMAVLESVRQSVANAKEVQKKKIGENVDLVVQALKKIEADIRNRFDAVGNSIEKRVLSIQDGRDGANGKDGRDGKDGKSGKDGIKGDRGIDGQDGRDGIDGTDGISVVNAQIDFDGSLVITLSDGRELNVGEVVSQDIAEKIKVISTMSTNAAIAVKEEGTTITNGVKSINFVGTGITATTSGDDVTVTVAGGGGSGTVTSVAALTLGTSGTDLSSTVANSTTTPVITLNVPTASATNRGALSSADWTTFNNKGSGTVTSVTATSPVASSGGATPAISLSAGYGDTLNPYASKTLKFVLAAPNTADGVPTFRAIVASDIPTLNQNTTGTSSNVTGTVAIANGGTGLTSTPTNGQLDIGNGTGFTRATLTGTASQVTVTNAAGTITLSLPSSINVNTSGSAATLTTPRAIYGNNFDGSAALTQIVASTYGGTGNGFTKFSGATTAERTYTLPDATTTILTTNTAVTVGQGGTGQTSYTDGQLLIGNTTGNTLTKATLTAGTGISITNGGGSISIASTVTGTVTSVAATVPSFLSISGSPITSSGTLAISLSGTALPVLNGGTGVTTSTGSGATVLGTSPTLTTPTINSAQVATVSGTAPLYMCRAWVNFNGTANTNLSGTYARTSPSTTLTVTATAHGLIVGSSVNLDFTTGTGLDGIYTVVTVADANTFTITTVASTTTSGNVTLLRSTIRASGNVSSISDNGTGDYTVNFTTAMSDANYAVTFGAVSVAAADTRNLLQIKGTLAGGATTMTTSAVRIQGGDTANANAPADSALLCVSIFG